jgi:hypothetical protein
MRQLYTKVGREQTLHPHFRSLPEFLIFPNLEVTLAVSFSTGLVSCATSVIGAIVEGHATSTRSLAAAVFAILIVAVGYAWQIYRLYIFLQYHDDVCWVEAEKPMSKEEIDDPLYAWLTNMSMGLIKPTGRERGSFEAPEEDAEEPGRTERALARFFTLRYVRLEAEEFTELCA